MLSESALSNLLFDDALIGYSNKGLATSKPKILQIMLMLKEKKDWNMLTMRLTKHCTFQKLYWI